MNTAIKSASFSAEFEPAIMMGRRSAARAPVALDASIGRGKMDRAICRVTDLSHHGARLQTWSELKTGSLIWLSLPGIGPRAAEIRWYKDFEAGCLFQQPLDDEAFDLLAEI